MLSENQFKEFQVNKIVTNTTNALDIDLSDGPTIVLTESGNVVRVC